jgi:hypothetical protein
VAQRTTHEAHAVQRLRHAIPPNQPARPARAVHAMHAAGGEAVGVACIVAEQRAQEARSGDGEECADKQEGSLRGRRRDGAREQPCADGDCVLNKTGKWARGYGGRARRRYGGMRVAGGEGRGAGGVRADCGAAKTTTRGRRDGGDGEEERRAAWKSGHHLLTRMRCCCTARTASVMGGDGGGRRDREEAWHSR